MKLRLRSLQSKQTLKVEVPNSCTLQQLKEAIPQSFFSAVSSCSSVRFSLNRKDELIGSSPQDSLQFLGITSGDLIYFSVDPNDFSASAPEILGSSSSSFVQEGNNPHQLLNFQESEILGAMEQETLVRTSDPAAIGLNCSNQETPDDDLPVQESKTLGKMSAEYGMCDEVIEKQGSPVSNIQIGETLETQELDGEEGMDIDAGSLDVAGKKFSEPYFLRWVLKEEFGGDDGSDHKLLVIAIHAVFLESGFVGFDLVSGMRVDRFHLPEGLQIPLCYTLPELLDNDNITESVVLKFQVLGHFVNVYGSLAEGRPPVGPYRVCLNEYRFAPTLNSVWANYDKNERMDGNDRSSILNIENEVFEFWKIVKDALVLPLLIDLCDKTGLVLPSCLMRLPAELKFKILDSLPAVDVARMGCVCSEMRYLSSNNDLWKQKFEEEFGSGARAQGMTNWKERFASYWESRKKRKREISARQGVPHFRIPYGFPIRRDPDPLRFPSPMIGGDYDRLPGLGVPSPFGRPGQAFPRFQMRRNFSPNCNLGGFNT